MHVSWLEAAVLTAAAVVAVAAIVTAKSDA
jgi:hypothetical protein